MYAFVNISSEKYIITWLTKQIKTTISFYIYLVYCMVILCYCILKRGVKIQTYVIKPKDLYFSIETRQTHSICMFSQGSVLRKRCNLLLRERKTEVQIFDHTDKEFTSRCWLAVKFKDNFRCTGYTIHCVSYLVCFDRSNNTSYSIEWSPVS